MLPSLEDLLVKTKLISPPQLAVAQRDAETRQTSLAHALIDLGFVNERQFAEWLTATTNIPLVDPLRSDVISEIERHIPPDLARERQVVPIDVDADEMTIATANPLDRLSIDAIRDATGLKIHPVIGIRSQILEMVERFYPEPKTFDPSATIAAPLEEPFAFGDDTMLRHHSLEYAYGEGDTSLGSETRILPIPAPVPPDETTNPTLDSKPSGQTVAAAGPETQLDRIERHLDNLIHVVEGLQRRIDAIDSILARVLNRDR
jgi:MshEN domain